MEEKAYQLCISEPRMMAKLIVKLQALQDRERLRVIFF
jgi:hypothetical protein